MKTLHTFFLLFAFILAKAQSPTITFDNVTKTYGDAPFYMAASSNSSGAFTYSVLNTAIASIDQSGFLTIKKGGSTTVTATQAASAPYLAATKTATLTVNKATVFAVNITSGNTVYANDSLSLTATSNFADAKYKFNVKSQSGTNATIKGSKLYAGANTGTLDITGDVVADANFNGGTVSSTIAQTITVQASSGTPEIVFDNKTVSFGTAPINMAATSNSPAAISYSIDSGTVATVSANGLATILGAGRVKIKASQVAIGGFTASSKTAILTIEKGKILSTTISSPSSVVINDSINLVATSNPPGAKFNWSVLSENGTNATIKRTKLYAGTNTGSLNIQAEIIADDNYDIYTSSSTIVSSLVATQTVSVYSSLTPNLVFPNQSRSYDQKGFEFIMNAASNSSGTISYSVESGIAASIDNNGLISINGIGSVVIKATQAAYPPFTSLSKTAVLTIAKGNASIYNIYSANMVLLNDSLNLNANYFPSNLEVNWTIESQNGTGAFIKGTKLFAGNKRGTLIVVANLITDTNFFAPNPLKMTVSIDSAYKPTLYFSDQTIPFNSAPFKIGSYSNSTGIITYSIDTDTSISITSDGLMTIKKMGKTKVFLYQAASKPYTYISDTAIITIGKAKVYGISITSPNKVNINDSLTLTGTTNPVGAKLKWKINYGDSTGSIIKDSKIYAGSKIGILNITAEVVADEFFEAYVGSTTNTGSYGTQRINVNSTSGTPTIYFPDCYRDYSGESLNTFAMNLATSNSSGAFTYSISGEPSASINSNGVIIFKNLDSLRRVSNLKNIYQIVLTITAHQEASPPFDSASKTATLYLYTAIITGIEESNTSFSKPTAYPNPAKDILQIKSGKGAGCEAAISLYNMNGIEQNAISTRNGDDYQLDISELSSGIYSLKMTYCNEVFTQKVVKQ